MGHDGDKTEQPTGGDDRGASENGLVGPADETVDAVDVVDVDEPRVQRQQAVGELIEEAIVAVARTHAGTHSREIVRDALRRELEARGRWPQPETWLDAVATELEAGSVYTMGTETPGVSAGAASPSP
ncbi:hypothetical protein V3N99_00300 [Dermatophilaceae bacterium Soc4.6]